jgi:hypothetical protein
MFLHAFFLAIMKLILSALLVTSIANGYLRTSIRGSDFGCNGDDQACIKPDLIPFPQKLNPATISTNTNDSGFVTAESVDGDDGTDGDPGSPPKKDADPAAKYMISAPLMEAPPPMPPLIVCRSPEECTTTTTTLPPGVSR